MDSLTIGILAIQGAVEEHAICIKKLGAKTKEIRLPIDFQGIDGIILPGGESTAMAIVGEEYGLFPELKKWVQSGKPIWGTCAGMILLSDHAIKQKEGGQSLVGGLDVHICRNFFGPQINSCKVDLSTSIEGMDSSKFPAVFIRAPAIIHIGSEVTKLAEMKAIPHPSAKDDVISLINSFQDLNIVDSSGLITVIIAIRQKNILATSFHPELTNDLRWHKYFLEIVLNYKVSNSIIA